MSSSNAENLNNILLVEDNPMDVDLTRRAFAMNKLPVAIEVARDGEQALEYIARWDAGSPLPRVILLPGLGALCAGPDLRAATIAADITAHTLAVKAQIAREAGADRSMTRGTPSFRLTISRPEIQLSPE